MAESKMGVIGDEVGGLKTNIHVIHDEIAGIDASVTEATKQRKAEKAEFSSVMSELTMSSDLLLKARQVLEKAFAPPVMRKDAFVQEGATFDDSLDNFLSQAPETAGAHKKSGAGMGAVGLLNTLIAEVKAQQTAETKEEDDSQAEFDEFSNDSKGAKESKKKDILSMEASMSRLEETLLDAKTVHGQTQDEIDAVISKEHALHEECDFLMQNYDEIKKARNDELESITNAIAILSGANFGKDEEASSSFLQRQTRQI